MTIIEWRRISYSELGDTLHVKSRYCLTGESGFRLSSFDGRWTHTEPRYAGPTDTSTFDRERAH